MHLSALELGWCAFNGSYVDSWIQVDFLEPKKVVGVSTWGPGRELSEVRAHMKTFTLSISLDGASWKDITDNGQIVVGGLTFMLTFIFFRIS